MSEFNDFETTESKQDELTIQQIVEQKWKCKLHKMPQHFGADFVAYRDDMTVLAVVEVKTQSQPISKYGTMMTPMKKRQICLAVAAAGGVKALQVIQYPDGVYWVDMFSPPVKTKMIKDPRNRESGDFYPCVMWNMDSVHKMC